MRGACSSVSWNIEMVPVEFFFDLSSPWTRIAFHNIQALEREGLIALTWRPFLVGGVFNAVNDQVYAIRGEPDNPRYRHSGTWLREWADIAGVGMNFPSPHHPLKSVMAMRFCCALEHDRSTLFAFVARSFDAYFTDQLNLDDTDILIGIADELGMPGSVLAERASSPEVKARLRANTDEGIARGAFGSPTIFVDHDHVYFGNDQLPLVRRRAENSMKGARFVTRGKAATAER